jgi:hypothetical protein
MIPLQNLRKDFAHQHNVWNSHDGEASVVSHRLERERRLEGAVNAQGHGDKRRRAGPLRIHTAAGRQLFQTMALDHFPTQELIDELGSVAPAHG